MEMLTCCQWLPLSVGDGSKQVKGCFDSIHVVEVQERSSGRSATYKLTSTVMLWLETNKKDSGKMALGGSLTRQDERTPTDHDKTPNHIVHIGTMIEVRCVSLLHHNTRKHLRWPRC
jgi:capping protein beta